LSAANEEIAKLKQADGAESTVITKKTDATLKTDEGVFSEESSLEENIDKVTEAYL